MGSAFCSCILFLHAITVLQCPCSCSARKIAEQHSNIVDYKAKVITEDNHLSAYDKNNIDNFGQKWSNKMHTDGGDHQKLLEKHIQDHSSLDMNPKNLAANVFFTDTDLKAGKNMLIYFPIKEPSSKPPLLSREEADSIPFSSLQLPYLLDFFSFAKGSPQAKAMEDTLRHCEFEPIKGESKFCATSLESMLDSAREIIGFNTPFKFVTTNHLTKSTSLLENYTIVDEPKVISAPAIVACHNLPYPYAVFYCHSQKNGNKLFKVSLLGENGGKVDAAAVCHMNTSKWDPDHLAFQVLKTHPGGSPVCHYFPEDNIVWVASSTVGF